MAGLGGNSESKAQINTLLSRDSVLGSGMKLLPIGILFVACARALSQDRCPLPPSPFSNEPDIFNAQQEMELGDAAAQQLERRFHPIDDPQLNGPLQALGDRLLKNLPHTDMRYKFVLFDEPVLNAWGLPGGRIYVSRKMVAFARDEQELAGLLAHEIGHYLLRSRDHARTGLMRAELRAIDLVEPHRERFELAPSDVVRLGVELTTPIRTVRASAASAATP